MSTQNKCPFCKSELVSLVLPSNPPQYRTYCPNCKKYEESNFGQQGTLQDTVQDTQNDWAERFDKHYGDYGEDDFGSCSVECELRMENIKKFIAQELADARKEVGNGIEKMYLSVADKDPRYDTVEEIQAYNQAIYEILATLKEEKI